MFHHDAGDYQVASSLAGSRAKEVLQKIIDRGQAGAEAVIADIQSKVIVDRVARAPVVNLVYDDEGSRMLSVGGALSPLHDHAFGQILSNTKVGMDFHKSMQKEAGGDPWGNFLVSQAVNEVLAHREKQRNLIRGEGEEGMIKGFLSDSFRRLDSRPIAEAFIDACQDLGMLPIEGVLSDTKMRIRAVLPYVFEPRDNEVMIFGAELGNSDFATASLALNLWTMRIWCTNLAVAEKCLRQVHLGGKLPENIRLADDTYRKDAETTALIVRDVTADAVAPDRINRMLEAIKVAGDEEIRGRDGIDKILVKAAISSKTDRDAIATLYEGNDVQNLPEGNTKLRLSNAVSWFAQGKEFSADRKLDLQDAAGEILFGKSKGKTAREV